MPKIVGVVAFTKIPARKRNGLFLNAGSGATSQPDRSSCPWRRMSDAHAEAVSAGCSYGFIERPYLVSRPKASGSSSVESASALAARERESVARID